MLCSCFDIIACIRSTFGNGCILSRFFCFILISNKFPLYPIGFNEAGDSESERWASCTDDQLVTAGATFSFFNDSDSDSALLFILDSDSGSDSILKHFDTPESENSDSVLKYFDTPESENSNLSICVPGYRIFIQATQ
jgi:hypothetical protein